MVTRLRDAYTDVLADHHRIIRASLASHDATEIDTAGDGFFAVFNSASGCVGAVLEMQRALSSNGWPAGEQVKVRMGVHTGEATEGAEGLVGLDVHRAARIAAVGHGGQVLLSATTAEILRDSLPEGTRLLDLGPHRLKDLGHPEQIFQLEADGLASEFPPLRSLANPELPNNLPGLLSAFIGRESELTLVRDLVASSRLVTLTGAGGSGKTRLALQVAAELLDGTGQGVWFVELAPIKDPDDVPASVAASLDIRGQGERSLLESLIDTLSDQNVLIVLDNCEHVIGACAKFADHIVRRCPGVRLLATSREPLGIDGERVYRVPPLSLPPDGSANMEDLEGSDAVQLFVERATERDSAFALDDSIAPLVASICRRLDGIPLALELAAGRLGTMSLEHLSRRLDHRFRLLTGGSRNALPRQQTLHAMIDWSYDLLNGPEQSVLSRLSVFVGGFELEGAEAICAGAGLEAFDVDDLVGSLVNKSLVTAERSSGAFRYRMLETIRQYGLERLMEVGAAETSRVFDAHAEFYLALAEAAGPDLTGPRQGARLKRLDLEWDNLKAALAHLFGQPGRTEAVLRLGAALQDFLCSRGHYDAVSWLRDALERPDTVPALVRVRALLATAWQEVIILGMRGESVAIRSAGELGDRALEMARGLDDRRAVAEGLCLLSMVARCEHDQKRATFLAEEAVETARSLDDPWLSGLATLCLAVGTAWLSDDLGPADSTRSHELHLEALAHFLQAGDRLKASAVLAGLVNLETANGQLATARSRAEQAIAALEEMGAGATGLQLSLGVVLLLQGELLEAGSLFRTILPALRQRGDRDGVGWAIFGLACCAPAGDHRRAAQLHGAADVILGEFLTVGGSRMSPAEQRLWDDDSARLRQVMGEGEFDDDYAIGTGLTLDQAVDLALNRSNGEHWFAMRSIRRAPT